MKSEKEINEFTKFIIKEAGVESPSSNFVNKVMNTVAGENILAESHSLYKPLISKKGWFIMGVLLLSGVIFMSSGVLENAGLFSKLTTVFHHINLNILVESFNFSRTFMFSVLFFGVAVLTQLLIIKHFINSRL